jgi:hypothetical protein
MRNMKHHNVFANLSAFSTASGSKQSEPWEKHLRRNVNKLPKQQSFAVTPDVSALDDRASGCFLGKAWNTPAERTCSGVIADEKTESGTTTPRQARRGGYRWRAFDGIQIGTQGVPGNTRSRFKCKNSFRRHSARTTPLLDCLVSNAQASSDRCEPAGPVDRQFDW